MGYIKFLRYDQRIQLGFSLSLFSEHPYPQQNHNDITSSVVVPIMHPNSL